MSMKSRALMEFRSSCGESAWTRCGCNVICTPSSHCSTSLAMHLEGECVGRFSASSLGFDRFLPKFDDENRSTSIKKFQPKFMSF